MNRNLSLPEVLWIEIIVRLPVKSLICLKCVSKYWYDLIRSPNFVSYHYHNPFNLPKLLVCHRIMCQWNRYDMRQVFSVFPGEIRVAELTEMKSFSVIGPVEGLFMLYNYNSNEIGVWNPATTEFKQLRKPILSIRSEGRSQDQNVFGFGKNPLTNEYKVVCTPYIDYRLLETMTSSPSIKRDSSLWPRKGAAVGRLGSDGICSWRDIDGPELGKGCRIIGGRHIKSDATYSNGCYYWLSVSVCRKCGDFGHYKLVVFDMRTDVFTEMATPPFSNHENNYCCNRGGSSSNGIDLLTLGLDGDDNIALLVTQYEPRLVMNCRVCGALISASVSILKNKEENWIKVYTHKFEPNIGQELRFPLGIWKNNGIFFMHENKRLLLYSNASDEIVDLGVNYAMVYNYKESLVSFGGHKKNGHKKHSAFQNYFA